jgi:hypothetical protein
MVRFDELPELEGFSLDGELGFSAGTNPPWQSDDPNSPLPISSIYIQATPSGALMWQKKQEGFTQTDWKDLGVRDIGKVSVKMRGGLQKLATVIEGKLPVLTLQGTKYVHIDYI